MPPAIAGWFAAKGWSPRPHQMALLEKAQAGRSTLLIAPTGAGKTLAGFLPSLVDLHGRPRAKPGEPARGIHTLYLSPLKALAVDVARNVVGPAEEMGLGLRIETRTGDTPTAKRQRQSKSPPDILMTTPEQLALLISNPRAKEMFGNLRRVVIDELHALVTTKRGELLALGLARLRKLSPGVTMTGLSATVAHPDALRAWLTPRYTTDGEEGPLADLVTTPPVAKPDVTVLASDSRIPWSGHSARYAIEEVMAAIRAHKLVIVFVNTRSQAESTFQGLWMANDEALPIALHHGSLDVAQRRRVEAAMAEGKLRAVVATATLDLGIDWGDVDLVVHVGAPKGASRLAQRIGRANHRLDEPSRAILVPANRFEIMECEAAAEALERGAQDSEMP
ncbi:MAG: DEAD/DEAH box helicase, partial [Pseudomonadota bacterium]